MVQAPSPGVFVLINSVVASVGKTELEAYKIPAILCGTTPAGSSWYLSVDSCHQQLLIKSWTLTILEPTQLDCLYR